MTKINDGGPAFPVPLNPGESYQSHALCDGMTLRDYFAAKALGYMLGVGGLRDTCTFATPEGRSTAAKCCYLMADAMLAARGDQ